MKKFLLLLLFLAVTAEAAKKSKTKLKLSGGDRYKGMKYRLAIKAAKCAI